MVLFGAARFLATTTPRRQPREATEGLRTNVYPPRGDLYLNVRLLCVSLHKDWQCNFMHHGRCRLYITGRVFSLRY